MTRLHLKEIVFVWLIFIFSGVFSQNVVGDTFGKGLTAITKDSSLYVKFGFRFQTLYVGQTDPSFSSWEEQMMIRRSRLKFDGWAFSPQVKYKVELGVSNRDTRAGRFDESGNTSNIILDAVLKWEFAPGWELWAGQTKLPGNRERVISSQKLQFVDRSLVNSRFNLDRDIGIQLRHESSLGQMVIREAFALSMGEGRDIIVDNPDHGRQYTGRVEFLPFGNFTSKGDYFGSDLKREPTPKLSIGITADYNNNTVRSRGNLGSFVTDLNDDYIYSDLATVLIDGMFKYKGLSIVSEYAYRSTSKKAAGFGYGQGITGSLGYLFDNDMEVALRYTQIEPISSMSSIDQAEEYMIGLSRYIVGHSLKVQSDFSYTAREMTRDFLMFRLQFELAI